MVIYKYAKKGLKYYTLKKKRRLSNCRCGGVLLLVCTSFKKNIQKKKIEKKKWGLLKGIWTCFDSSKFKLQS